MMALVVLEYSTEEDVRTWGILSVRLSRVSVKDMLSLVFSQQWTKRSRKHVSWRRAMFVV